MAGLSIKLYEEEMRQLVTLPVEQGGKILYALLCNELNCEMPEFEAAEKVIFNLIKGQTERARELSEKRSQVRKGNKQTTDKSVTNADKHVSNCNQTPTKDKQTTDKSVTNADTNTSTNTSTNTYFKDSCAEQSSDADAPRRKAIITLTLNDKTEYPVYEEQAQEWAALYPAVDVIQQFRNMKGWIISHPKERKTRAGILKFINRWLAREQNLAGYNAKKTGDTTNSSNKPSNRFVNFEQRKWDYDDIERKAREKLIRQTETSRDAPL